MSDDILLRNGQIVDGTGVPRFDGALRIGNGIHQRDQTGIYLRTTDDTDVDGMILARIHRHKPSENSVVGLVTGRNVWICRHCGPPQR